MEPSTSEIK